jgi:hypothetical protein
MAVVAIIATDGTTVASANATPISDGTGYNIDLSQLAPAGQTIRVSVNGEDAWQGIATGSDQ